MNTLALAVALLSISTAPVATYSGATTVASVTATNATLHVAALDPIDPLPKCFPYCK